MSERFTKLFSLPENLYAEGSPLVIAAGALQKDNQSGRVFAQLKFKSITGKTIKAVKVKLFPLDTIGNAIDGEVPQEYLDLKTVRDADFGQKTAIAFPNASTRGFAVEVTEVYFADNSVWSGSGAKWEALPQPETLESALGDRELVKQYRIKYGADSKFAISEHLDLWRCSCGAWNRNGEKCHVCGMELWFLKAADLEELKAERDARLKAQRQKAEAEKQAAEAKTKKTKKLAMIIVPIIVVAAVAAVLISGSVKKSNAYNEAMALAEALKYDEAIAAFLELGNYKDSAEQVKITEKAKEEDTKRESYNNAVSLFEAGHHPEAYAAFEALGDYLDSKEYLNRYERIYVLLSETHEDNGKKGFSRTYEYRDGLLIKETGTAYGDTLYGFHAYGLSNGDTCTAEYEYDSNGNKTEVRVYRKDGTLIHTYSYKYDDMGTLIEETARSIYATSKPTTSVYEYDDRGNVILRTWYQNTSASGPIYSEHYYEYDEQNQLIYERWGYDWGGETEITYENEYDSNDRLVKQTSLSLKNNYVHMYEFEYDNNGNMIAKRETNDHGSWEYTYDYDEFGNMIKEVYSGTSSSPSRTTTYIYDYIYTLK